MGSVDSDGDDLRAAFFGDHGESELDGAEGFSVTTGAFGENEDAVPQTKLFEGETDGGGVPFTTADGEGSDAANEVFEGEEKEFFFRHESEGARAGGSH